MTVFIPREAGAGMGNVSGQCAIDTHIPACPKGHAVVVLRENTAAVHRPGIRQAPGELTGSKIRSLSTMAIIPWATRGHFVAKLAGTRQIGNLSRIHGKCLNRSILFFNPHIQPAGQGAAQFLNTERPRSNGTFIDHSSLLGDRNLCVRPRNT